MKVLIHYVVKELDKLWKGLTSYGILMIWVKSCLWVCLWM